MLCPPHGYLLPLQLLLEQLLRMPHQLYAVLQGGEYPGRGGLKGEGIPLTVQCIELYFTTLCTNFQCPPLHFAGVGLLYSSNSSEGEKCLPVVRGGIRGEEGDTSR